MSKTRRLRRGICRWALVLAVAICAQPRSAVAQGRSRGGGPPGGRPRRGDPTDPARRDAALQQKADRYYQAGERLLAKGRTRRAIVKFKSAVELVGAQGAGQAALGRLRALHQQGMEALDEVRTLIEKERYRDALELARKTRITYANLFGGIEAAAGMPNIAHLAAGLVKAIEANPAARIEIQEYEAGRRAKRIPARERRAKKDPRRYLDLYKTLSRIAKRFPDCPTGKRCARQAAKLRADRRIWPLIERERERRFIAATLRSVEQLERAGLKKEAAQAYQKLRRKYPTKSRKQLREMAEG